jgi:hypothetical protein
VLARVVIAALVDVITSFVIWVQNEASWTCALVAARDVHACVFAQFFGFTRTFVNVSAGFVVLV